MTANHAHTRALEENIKAYRATIQDYWYLMSEGMADTEEIGRGFDNFIAHVRAAAEQRGAARAEQAIYELTEAIRFTVEYVGNDTLPPIDGWSWFDALRKYRPELAEHFEQNPQLRPDNHVTREIIAEQIAARLEDEDV